VKDDFVCNEERVQFWHMNENNLKAAIELQKELFKTVQDQIKNVEERAR
jgi:hypothetical protein